LTKEELVSKLTAAVGDSPYGKELIAEAEKTFGDADKKYGWDMKDRLDLRLGILKAYARIDKAFGKEARETADEDKIAVIEKALKAIEQ
jgi:hypothetical protein